MGVYPCFPCLIGPSWEYTRASCEERSGRKWGPRHYRVRKGEGKIGVSSASLPLLVQEDP
eukprot:17859-Prorocentrum_minimum.AAC.1